MKNSTLAVILTLLFASAQLHAVIRPELETRPVGFAGIDGVYGIPVCNNGEYAAPSAAYSLVTVSNATELSNALKTKSNQIILIEGGTYSSFTLDSYTNYSLIGLGNVVFNSGCSVKGSSRNVLIRNISVIGYSSDGLDITGSATNVWIDHCTIGWNVTSSNKNSPDGAMDITSNSNAKITISWCKIMNTWKTSLHGSGDSDGASVGDARQITHYCNYYYNTDQRTPRIRGGKTHVLNCLYENSGWERPISMTASEHDWAAQDHYKNDAEYVSDRLLNAIGYGILAAKNADVNVDSCFFFDVRWPIVASRPCEEFREKYGDLQSPDINNGCRTGDNGNGGCYAVRQTGNSYSDVGLTTTIEVKSQPRSYDASTNPMSIVPLDYSYTDAGGETQYVIRPTMLNPGKKSIKFDEYQPSRAFNPSSYSNYYPAGYTPRTSDEIHELVVAYAGADSYTMACDVPAATLIYTGELNQDNLTTISDIVFTWGGGATDVFVTGMPDANMTKNMGAKTLTISGAISELIQYTVTTKGGSGEAITYSGILYPKGYSASCGKMATINVNVSTPGSYDLKIFNGSGELIKTVFSGSFATGSTNLIFAATDLDSGDYTYKLMNGASIVDGQTGVVTIP